MPVGTVGPGAPAVQVATQRELLVICADVVALKSPHTGVPTSCSGRGSAVNQRVARKKAGPLAKHNKAGVSSVPQRDQLHEDELRR